MNKEQCKTLAEVTSNIVFFFVIANCLQALPTALKYFENQVLVDFKITAVEKSVTEVATVL